MSDTEPFAAVLLVGAVVGLLAVLSARLTERIPVPAPLLVLVGAPPPGGARRRPAGGPPRPPHRADPGAGTVAGPRRSRRRRGGGARPAEPVGAAGRASGHGGPDQHPVQRRRAHGLVEVPGR